MVVCRVDYSTIILFQFLRLGVLGKGTAGALQCCFEQQRMGRGATDDDTAQNDITVMCRVIKKTERYVM